MRVNFGLWVKCMLWVKGGLQVTDGLGLMRVVFVSTRVKADRVRVEFFQLVRVMGRVSVRVFLQL